jgi:iron complex outermembrane receptor protein
VVATPIDSRIKLIYGRAFRAPSFLELYDKNNPADFGNPNLDAEKLDTLEVAYIQTIAEDLLNVGVNYYYTHFRDLIAFGVPVVAPNNPFGARQFVNAGSADNQGLELELKAQPIKALFLTATYSHLLGKGVGLMTKDAASLAANYQFRKLTFGTTSVVRGKVNGATALAPYWLLNGGVRYAVTPKLGIRFDVRNILDSQNRTPSNFLPDGVANRGRAFMLSILYAR